VVSAYERGNAFSGSIEGKGFPGWPVDHRLHKKTKLHESVPNRVLVK
jgi:hypothetical protein